MFFTALSLLIALVLPPQDMATNTPDHREVRAYVTGYNTLRGQTDKTPCIAASRKNICGRRDVVACPREIPLGTVVEIRGDKVRLGIVAPKEVPVHRQEVYDAIHGKDAAEPAPSPVVVNNKPNP